MDFTKALNLIYDNSGHLAIICLSINVLLSLLNFKKLSLSFQRLSYFLVFTWLIEISARIFILLGINNLPLLHLYTLGEFILLSFFYKSLITKPSFFQNRYWYFVIVGAVFIGLNSLFFQSIYGFNTLAKTAVQITIISYAILYFYNLTENQPFSPEIAKSLRLINSAVLIYYSGSLFIFMCSQFSFDNEELYKLFWAFNAVFNVVFQLLILWGIWKVIFPKITLPS